MRLTNRPPPLVHLGNEGTTEGLRARALSRVLSVVARGSAAGGGERAGARVVSSDKEVTNCLARRAPGRPRDVLGTKLAPTGRVDRYRKTTTGCALALRSIVTCEIMRTPSKPDPDDRRIYRRATASPGKRARSSRFNFWEQRYPSPAIAPQPGFAVSSSSESSTPRNPTAKRKYQKCRMFVDSTLSLSPEFKWNYT